MRRLIAVTATFLLMAAAPLSSPPPAVVVQPVSGRDVSPADTFTGQVQAIQSVNIIARVQAYIDRTPRCWREEMAASIARMRLVASQDEFIQENRVFHETVARVGCNDVLESFWSAISLLASGEQHGITYSFGNRMHVVEAHEEILRACRAREPAVAAARMAAHVGELEHLVRRRYRSLLDEPTRMMVKVAG